jgi:hypothetical protein
MKYLLAIMLLLPTIASANYPITYFYVGEQVYDSTGSSIILKKDAVIDEDGFQFIFNEYISLED